MFALAVSCAYYEAGRGGDQFQFKLSGDWNGI